LVSTAQYYYRKMYTQVISCSPIKTYQDVKIIGLSFQWILLLPSCNHWAKVRAYNENDYRVPSLHLSFVWYYNINYNKQINILCTCVTQKSTVTCILWCRDLIIIKLNLIRWLGAKWRQKRGIYQPIVYCMLWYIFIYIYKHLYKVKLFWDRSAHF